MTRRALLALLLIFHLTSSQKQNNLASSPKTVSAASDPDANVTERQSGSVATAAPEALTGAASNRAIVSYYGASVREAYVEQPAATLVRLAEAHQRFGAGAGIVAIIDTGVDPSHPALARSLVQGYDFTRNTTLVNETFDLDPLAAAKLAQSTVAFLDSHAARLNQSTVAFLDQSTVAFLDGKLPAAFGHGTMVAGLVHLVAPTAKIMPLKAFRADGTSRVPDIVRAVYYAADHGATVINMSFSLSGSSPELAEALEYATSRKVICVASAGNMGKPVKLYPAGYSDVIGVGSTNLLDKRSAFSNYDVSSAKIAAPGEALITTFPGNHYAGVWGTSFSGALVSGGVALLLQARHSASLDQVEDALDHGAEIEQKMGDARLDLVSSIQYLLHDEDSRKRKD